MQWGGYPFTHWKEEKNVVQMPNFLRRILISLPCRTGGMQSVLLLTTLRNLWWFLLTNNSISDFPFLALPTSFQGKAYLISPLKAGQFLLIEDSEQHMNSEINPIHSSVIPSIHSYLVNINIIPFTHRKGEGGRISHCRWIMLWKRLPSGKYARRATWSELLEYQGVVVNRFGFEESIGNPYIPFR